MTLKDNHLLWLDLETTGTDEEHDCILEIGCVLTDIGLNEIARYTTLVRPAAEGYGRMMLNPVVRKMHAQSGLIDDLEQKEPPPIHKAIPALRTWLWESGAQPGHVVLAGSGVGHFDRRFIRRWAPQLERDLRYWVIDIGVVRRAWEMWTGRPMEGVFQSKAHRALPDAVDHLSEARRFQAYWLVTSDSLEYGRR